MTAIIELENMEFYSGHGCYDLEKTVGNRFVVSVKLDVDLGNAALHDDLSGSINYLTVYEVVRCEMEVNSNILENVANRILDALYEKFDRLLGATVKVSKLAPPLGGKVEKASVTMSK